MERNVDSRITNISNVSTFPRRRQRITTQAQRDSNDEDGRMELQETVRFRDRERLMSKNMDRDFTKRRRVDMLVVQHRSGGDDSDKDHESTDLSDEDYCREEHDGRTHRRNRGPRTVVPSLVVGDTADEMLGFTVPRRARSASIRRVQECPNSETGGIVEELSERLISLSPAKARGGVLPGAPPSSFVGPLKKKTKSLEAKTGVLSCTSNSKFSSAIQDDIEIEVAEALFDLMKQSQSQSRISREPEKRDGDYINYAYDDLQRLNVNHETILVDSMKEMKQGVNIEKNKFLDDPAQEIVSGDGLVNKREVGSPNESESLSSYVKVNARDIQYPTVTNANNAAIAAETKMGTKLEIDLMATPPLPASPEREALVDVNHQDVKKNGDAIGKNIPSIVLPQMQAEKTELIRCKTGNKQRQLAQRDLKNPVPTSWLPLSSEMNNWQGVFPHPVYPIDEGFRSSMIMTVPEFTLSQPRPKKCATHHYIASNIQHHEILIKENLSSVPNVPATLYGAKLLNLNPQLRTQNSIPGDPVLGDFERMKNSTAISSGNGRGKSSERKNLLQQALQQAPADNLLYGSGFLHPVGQHQPSKTAAPANLSATPAPCSASLPSNSAGTPSFKLPFPGGATALSFSHPILAPSEAAPYMTLLQNRCCSIPISANIPLPTFKRGTPTVPLFDPSLYYSPVFNAAHSQPLSLPHASVQSESHSACVSLPPKPPDGQQHLSAKNGGRKFLNSAQPSYSSNQSGMEISRRSSLPRADGLSSLNPYYTQTPSFPFQQMNFAGVPLVSMGDGGAIGHMHGDSSLQDLKDRFDLPSQGFALPFGIHASASPALVDASSAAMSRGVSMTVPIFKQQQQWNQHGLIQFQKKHQQLPVSGTAKSKAPRATSNAAGSFMTNSSALTKTETASLTGKNLTTFGNGNSSVSCHSFQGQQSAIKRESATLSPVGSPSNPSIMPSSIKSSTGSTGFATCSVPT